MLWWTWNALVKYMAMTQLVNTPRKAPEKATMPLRVTPATRKMMTPVKAATTARDISTG